MLEHIQEASNYIRTKSFIKPQFAIVLGSGLSNLASEIDQEISIPYRDIPNFPVSTVEGHSGELILGHLEGIPVIALKGRFHYYEGYTMKETTLPIRVFKDLGVKTLLLSNASGGLNPNQKIGDLMVITDHMHLFEDNPLRGKNYDELGPRFPDMSEPYSEEYIALARKIDQDKGLNLKYGVYAGTAGPNYETRSEYKYFRIIGADAVGMSTTAETIVAVHGGMRVFGVSVISDMGVEGQVVEISHDEVQAVAQSAGPKMVTLFTELIKNISL